MRKLNNNGFTIVELMISTTVFAIVVLVLTAGIMQISKTYYKGITSSQTQGVVRAIMEDVGQAIQLSGGTYRSGISGGGYSGSYCIGSRLYMYKNVNQNDVGVTGNKAAQLTATSGPVLMGETISSSCSSVVSLSPPPPGVSNAAEKLQQKMRLVKFIITPRAGQLYDVTVRVVAGDDDMLCSPTFASNKCQSGAMASTAELSQPDLQCKGISGQQYCAVSEITTTVARRVN